MSGNRWDSAFVTATTHAGGTSCHLSAVGVLACSVVSEFSEEVHGPVAADPAGCARIVIFPGNPKPPVAIGGGFLFSVGSSIVAKRHGSPETSRPSDLDQRFLNKAAHRASIVHACTLYQH